MSNVVIIGNGPAGISAALYLTRAGIDTTVIGKSIGALEKASEIENFYGFTHPISGTELAQTGIDQAKRLGASIVIDEVVSISYEDKLTVITKSNRYAADSVLIATGAARSAPRIPGLQKYEGMGVSYCAVCDAFFYRGKDVAVLGNGEYALHEAMELLPTSKSVSILTNGLEPSVEIPEEIPVIKHKITELTGDDALQEILFENGEKMNISGLFIAVGVAGSTDLARKIGAFTENNKIVTDDKMATNVPGIYAAGDCTGGLLQVSKAVYEGALAGTEIIKFLRKQKTV